MDVTLDEYVRFGARVAEIAPNQTIQGQIGCGE